MVAVLLMLALLIASAAWHYRENMTITRRWRQRFKPDEWATFSRMVWLRSFQLWGALALSAVIIALYAAKLSRLEQVLAEGASQERLEIQALQQKNQDQAEQIAQSQQEIISRNATIGSLQEEVYRRTYYPPAVRQTPTESTATAPTATTSGIEEIYSPAANDNGADEAIDDLKKRYEETFVTYYYMSKCGKAGADDYSGILSALNDDLAALSAPSRLQGDILTAAQGSYQEIYSESPCDDVTLAPLLPKYNEYIRQLSINNNHTAISAEPRLRTHKSHAMALELIYAPARQKT